MTDLASIGRWLFLLSVFLMVTGDGPSSTVRVERWPTPAPFLAWPWLYLTLMAGSIACLAASGVLTSRKPAHLRFLTWPLAGVLVAFLLSSIFSQVHSLSVVAFLSVLGIVGFCGVAAVLLEDDAFVRAAWPALAIAVLLLAFRVVVWRRDEGLDVVAFQVPNNAWLGKLQLAWVLNLFAPLLLARFLGEDRRSLAVLYATAWAVTAIAIYLLFSRMGAVVFGLTTLGVCALNRAYWRRYLVVMVLGAVLGGGLVIRSADTFRYVVSTIIQTDRNPGVNQRLGVWREALRLFRDHPIVGTGLGTFDDVSFSLEGTTADRIFFRNGWHAHNVYLHLLAETGILGLLAWCYFWYAIVGHLAHGMWRADTRGRLDVAGTLCAVSAFLVLSMTEVLIGARVIASLRMNLTIGLVVVLGLHAASRTAGLEKSRQPASQLDS